MFKKVAKTENNVESTEDLHKKKKENKKKDKKEKKKKEVKTESPKKILTKKEKYIRLGGTLLAIVLIILSFTVFIKVKNKQTFYTTLANSASVVSNTGKYRYTVELNSEKLNDTSNSDNTEKDNSDETSNDSDSSEESDGNISEMKKDTEIEFEVKEKSNFTNKWTDSEGVAISGVEEDLPYIKLVFEGVTTSIEPLTSTGSIKARLSREDSEVTICKYKIVNDIVYLNVAQMKKQLELSGNTYLIQLQSKIPSNISVLQLSEDDVTIADTTLKSADYVKLNTFYSRVLKGISNDLKTQMKGLKVTKQESNKFYLTVGQNDKDTFSKLSNVVKNMGNIIDSACESTQDDKKLLTDSQKKFIKDNKDILISGMDKIYSEFTKSNNTEFQTWVRVEGEKSSKVLETNTVASWVKDNLHYTLEISGEHNRKISDSDKEIIEPQNKDTLKSMGYNKITEDSINKFFTITEEDKQNMKKDKEDLIKATKEYEEKDNIENTDKEEEKEANTDNKNSRVKDNNN